MEAFSKTKSFTDCTKFVFIELAYEIIIEEVSILHDSYRDRGFDEDDDDMKRGERVELITIIVVDVVVVGVVVTCVQETRSPLHLPSPVHKCHREPSSR